MKIKFLKYLFILCFVFYNYSYSYAQEDSSEVLIEDTIVDMFYIDTVNQKINEIVEEKKRKKKSYINGFDSEETEVIINEFDSAKWEKYHSERDYIEKERKEEEPNDFDMPKIEGLGFLGTLIKILVYLTLFLGIAFIIFKLFEAQFRKDAIINNEKKFFIEKLEEQIHEVDLYKLLEEYTGKKDFRMMVRIQYLIVIKELTNRQLIDWQIQKTNGTYLQEMYSHKLFAPFQNLTVLFERVWFGEVAVDEKIYQEIEPLFKKTIEDIKKINIGNK